MPKRKRPVPDRYTPSIDGRPRATVNITFRLSPEEVALLCREADRRESSWYDVLVDGLENYLMHLADDEARDVT